MTTQRLVAVVALLAAAVEVALRFGVVHISTGRFPLGIALGAALAVTGVILWVGATRKALIGAATVIALVGIAQSVALLFP